VSLEERIETDILEISADYILTRYPSLSELAPFKQYTLDIASEKVSAAKRIFTRLEPEYRSILEDA
jgi:HEPN domain-containing protein